MSSNIVDQEDCKNSALLNDFSDISEQNISKTQLCTSANKFDKEQNQLQITEGVYTKEDMDDDTEKLQIQNIEKLSKEILNKVNFCSRRSLRKQLLKLPIDTEEKLKCVVNLIFEEAINNHCFSGKYANMCKRMASKTWHLNTDFNSGKFSDSVKVMLHQKCKTEFQKHNNDELKYKPSLQQSENSETGENMKQNKKDIEEMEKSRSTSFGIIKFIGELLKINILNASFMHECLKSLLNLGDEHSLECFCLLITTVGKQLENNRKKRNEMAKLSTEYFEIINEIVNQHKISPKVSSMLKDISEIMKNNWLAERKFRPRIRKNLFSPKVIQINKSQTLPIDDSCNLEEDEKLYTQRLLKSVEEILNDITSENLQKLIKQVKSLPINTGKELKCVIDFIFEKAVKEHEFIVIYANICKNIAIERKHLYSSSKILITIKKMLYQKCMTEFQKQFNKKVKYKTTLQQIPVSDKNENLCNEILTEEGYRQRSFGIVKFIGELSKMNMLKPSIIYECLKTLLIRNDEHSLECLCLLLTIIGNKTEINKKIFKTLTRFYNEYLETIKIIVRKRKNSLKICSKLQDIIETIENNWFLQKDLTCNKKPCNHASSNQIEEINLFQKLEIQKLLKTVEEILNNLIFQNFEIAVQQIKSLPIDTEEELERVIDLIFNKAISEPNSIPIYAIICKYIAIKRTRLNSGAKILKTIKRMLCQKCLTEFEETSNFGINYNDKLQEIIRAEMVEKRQQLIKNLEEEERERRYRSLGIMKFTGELLKHKMIIYA